MTRCPRAHCRGSLAVDTNQHGERRIICLLCADEQGTVAPLPILVLRRRPRVAQGPRRAG